jgi:hypothetical protein
MQALSLFCCCFEWVEVGRSLAIWSKEACLDMYDDDDDDDDDDNYDGNDDDDDEKWSSYDRIWFSGSDKQEILIVEYDEPGLKMVWYP